MSVREVRTVADERRLEVLRAIVEDYVATHEPVGSRALLERHGLGVSAATIRNDMALLEDEGLISQPHTSAGRIPTELGYRLFVDRLATVKDLTAPERRAIETFLVGAVDLDDVVQRSARVLAQLTNQVAIMQYPTLGRSTVLQVELVALESARVLVVVIASSGRVEQRIVELAQAPSDDELAAARRRVADAIVGKRVSDTGSLLDEAAATVGPEGRDLFLSVSHALHSLAASEPAEQRFAVSGTANLAHFGVDFETAVRPVLEALEEQVVLLKLLGEAQSNALTVRIGGETGLSSTAVVSAGYGGETPVATLGTVGPTRMDYPATMAAVAAVARYVGRIVNDG